MDKQPHLVQKQLIRLLYHTHYTNFASPGIVGSSDPNKIDIFLAHPQIDFLNKSVQNKENQSNNNIFNSTNPILQQNPSIQLGIPSSTADMSSQILHNQQSVNFLYIILLCFFTFF